MPKRHRRGGAADHGGAHEAERWLVSYADFVTLLFAFFVVLFATSEADARKIAQVQQSLAEGFDPWALESPFPGGSFAANTPVEPPVTTGNADFVLLRRVLSRSLGNNETTIYEEEGRLVVRVHDGMLFDVGAANLRGRSHQLIDELGKALVSLPAREVWLEGHTDNRPIHTAEFPSNWELSTARAIAVLDALVKCCGLPPERFAASGYGEFRPIQPNSSAAGRSANRRVDIIILPNGRGEQRNTRPTAGKPSPVKPRN